MGGFQGGMLYESALQHAVRCLAEGWGNLSGTTLEGCQFWESDEHIKVELRHPFSTCIQALVGRRGSCFQNCMHRSLLATAKLYALAFGW